MPLVSEYKIPLTNVYRFVVKATPGELVNVAWRGCELYAYVVEEEHLDTELVESVPVREHILAIVRSGQSLPPPPSDALGGWRYVSTPAVSGSLTLHVFEWEPVPPGAVAG